MASRERRAAPAKNRDRTRATPAAGAKLANARPTPGTNPLISLRLDADLLGLVDEELERRRQTHPGTHLSRADVVRDALWRTLRPAPPARR